MANKRNQLVEQEKQRIKDELEYAYEFDPQDPLFGLNQAELSGSTLKRRTVLRLMAAAGTLSLSHLLPGVAITTRLPGRPPSGSP